MDQFVGPDAEKTSLADLAEMLRTDYTINERRSLVRFERSIGHLLDFFGADAKATNVTSDVIGRYALRRKEEGAKNATVNRELAALERAFRLAERVGKVTRRPYIQMLEERNTRTGFVEAGELYAIVGHLPADLRPVALVAYLTGWRVPSEILTREWRNVDLGAGWLRLEPGETKNGEGRSFPFTPELRSILEDQRTHTTTLERETDRIIPCVFHRRGKPIKDFRKAWKQA